MNQLLRTPLFILRRPQVQVETGYSRSTLYLRIAHGLFVTPIRIGKRAVGFPAGEVEALNSARIAGKSDAEIRTLVNKLHAARQSSNDVVAKE